MKMVESNKLCGKQICKFCCTSALLATLSLPFPHFLTPPPFPSLCFHSFLSSFFRNLLKHLRNKFRCVCSLSRSCCSGAKEQNFELFCFLFLLFFFLSLAFFFVCLFLRVSLTGNVYIRRRPL